jgi:hypothetical protein
MCILIHHPKDAVFTSAQLADFYSKNSDGFGAIVKKGNTVEVIKNIGTLAEIEDLYFDQVACHEAVIHFRMKTHGEIDIANCHPYEVVPGIWMAHIGDHIGTNNKFALMNEAGDVAIINRTSGYDFWDLANKDLTVWYSNTYAFDPYEHGFMDRPKYQPATYGHGSYYGSSPTWAMWDKFDKDERQGTLSLPSTTPKKKKHGKATQGKKKFNAKGKLPKYLSGEALKRVIRASYNAIAVDGYFGALKWVEDNPMMAMNFLYQTYGNENYEHSTAQEISDLVNFAPDQAADDVLCAWDEIEDELLEIAEITPVKSRINKEFSYDNV